ncbi:MAG: hypothetical protein M3457_11615 [Chloroflexota bacterium]|nr:hypothetical protein [Chloroflexota bacterium]
MTDDTNDREGSTPAGSGRSEGTLGAVRTTLAKRDSKGRPLAVYGILGIGVVTLLALMLVIYFWSADRDQPEQPICTSISPNRAEDGVRDGEVAHLILGYDAGVERSTEREWGPVLARIDYVDGQCATLPQGIANQADILSILGAIAFYNQTTESAQIEVTYNAMTGLEPILFTTPTTVPAETPVPTEPPVSPVSTPAATPAPAPTGAPTEVPATPASSPAATPRAATLTPTPTRTPTSIISPAPSPPSTP